MLTVAGRLGDVERAAIVPFERREDDEAARIAHEHGFDGMRLQAFRGLARSRDVGLEVVLRAALVSNLRRIVELPAQREASAD